MPFQLNVKFWIHLGFKFLFDLHLQFSLKKEEDKGVVLFLDPLLNILNEKKKNIGLDWIHLFLNENIVAFFSLQISSCDFIFIACML